MIDPSDPTPERDALSPPPNVVQAMMAGDVVMVKAWLAHPDIGSGNAMNAVAIFLLERLERSESDRASLAARWREQAAKDFYIATADVEDGVWSYQHEALGRAKARLADADDLAALRGMTNEEVDTRQRAPDVPGAAGSPRRPQQGGSEQNHRS